MIAASLFDDLVVVDMATTPAGAPVGQFFADYGANVILVEAPEGSPLRSDPGFAYWGRGKRSVELDLKRPDGLAELYTLIARADVVIQTFRPGVAARLHVDHATLSALNPRLVQLSVTGFAPGGPLGDVAGYEALVLAKVGALHQASGMVDRDGPAFISAPYCSATAALLGTHAVLAALIERESSGLGQHVEVTMAQALGAHDTWNGMVQQMAKRYPEAFPAAASPVDDEGIPLSGMLFRIMTGMSSDGVWLQFSQSAERLFRAFMVSVELDWMFDDPQWGRVPDLETAAQRREFWDLLLRRIKGKSLAEWTALFDENPDVWAEVFRGRDNVFEHPQLVHDGSVITIDDAEHGPVRQFAPLFLVDGERPRPATSAPTRDQHGAGVRASVEPSASHVEPVVAATQVAGEGSLPLEGVVILELATQYAAPYGATLLTDLGARVIKVESPEGDQIRWMEPQLPEVGAAKVTQGKQSVVVDLRTEDGLRIVHQIAARADVVLQGFRPAVAQRRSIDADTLQGINPNLVYVSAPAYGSSGPCSNRPAYAPTIGAACGLAWRNVGFLFERHETDLDAIKAASMQLRAGNMGAAHADGFAALGVGASLLLGIYARQHGLGAHRLETSMLLTTAHAVADGFLTYPGQPAVPTVDDGLYGLSALYRLYPTAHGWIVLAAPHDKEWAVLCRAVTAHIDLAGDVRFSTAAQRQGHDTDLAQILGELFLSQDAATWEAELAPHGVGCVRVTEETPFSYLYGEEFGQASGFVTQVTHLLFGEHLRMSPFAVSRSRTQALPGGLQGQHSDDVLAELGYDAESIKDLRNRTIVA